MFGSCNMTLIISNEEMSDIMKIINSLEESGLLTKGVGQTIKNQAKKQKGGFPEMLLDTLGVSLVGNQLTGKYTIGAAEVTVLALLFLMVPHSLTNFEIQKYYQNDPKFNGLCKK